QRRRIRPLPSGRRRRRRVSLRQELLPGPHAHGALRAHSQVYVPPRTGVAGATAQGGRVKDDPRPGAELPREGLERRRPRRRKGHHRNRSRSRRRQLCRRRSSSSSSSSSGSGGSTGRSRGVLLLGCPGRSCPANARAPDCRAFLVAGGRGQARAGGSGRRRRNLSGNDQRSAATAAVAAAFCIRVVVGTRVHVHRYLESVPLLGRALCHLLLLMLLLLR
ncbi:unnamed protein product, partial [Ectocarpus sp. 12 AP-2014]